MLALQMMTALALSPGTHPAPKPCRAPLHTIRAADVWINGRCDPHPGADARAAAREIKNVLHLEEVRPPSSAEAAERVSFWINGKPPKDANTNAVTRFGTFTKQPDLVNGRPCYAHELRGDTMMWCSPNQRWSIGSKDHLGSDVSFAYAVDDGALLPEHIKGRWRIEDRHSKEWLETNAIKVSILQRALAPVPAAAATDVERQGADEVAAAMAKVAAAEARAAEVEEAAAAKVAAAVAKAEAAAAIKVAEAEARAAEKAAAAEAQAADAVGRAESAVAHKMADTAAVAVATRSPADVELDPEMVNEIAQTMLMDRVATARSLCGAAMEAAYRALAAAAVDAYLADEIDEDVLKLRKKAAREQAGTEHAPLVALDRAYGAYTAAMAAFLLTTTLPGSLLTTTLPSSAWAGSAWASGMGLEPA